MSHISRRSLLIGTSALIPAALLAGCGVVSSNTSNGVTTVTVNTHLAVTYVSGAAALAAAVLGFPGVSALLGAALPAIETALADINAAVPAIDQQANGAATFTFNTTSVPAFVSSLLADLSTIKSDASVVTTATGATIPAQAALYYNGFVSVANAIAGLFSIATPAAAALRPGIAPTMPVSDALALVHIKAPAG